MSHKILVTGAKGFLGGHLARRLAELGNDVVSFDIADKQDIRNLSQVCQATKEVNIVFHLAAIADLNWAREHPIETMKINVEGTWNVAHACVKSASKLYFASTCCVYGNQKRHPTTEKSLPNPAEIYGCSKLAGENVIKGMHYSFGLEYAMMRFATVYGPGAREALATHIFLRQALKGEPITVHGDGSQTRTLTYVDDLIDGVIALYQSGKVNDAWNLTATEEVSAQKMAEDIKQVTKSKSTIIHIPQRIGQTFKEKISADKMADDTGWRAQVSWSDGIERMRDWLTKVMTEKRA